MKIKGWEKLSGITYKGLCIVNPIHNANETQYIIDIINLNKPYKPKWRLDVVTDNHISNPTSTDFLISVEGEFKIKYKVIVSRAMMLKISDFRGVFEDLVDEMLLKEEKFISNITQRINGGSSTLISSSSLIK